MKLLVSIALLLVGSAAFANNQDNQFTEYKVEITALRTLSFDGETLKGGYSKGGGCQDHSTQFGLEFDEKNFEAKLRIYDVTSTPDYCDSFLYLEFNLNIRNLLQNEAEKKGLHWKRFTVILPKIDPSIF
ncbi:MAG: hypothetical protein K2Q26_02065 [Bdellovibrionales bacterium]|nr:hypothetical protein [Bdellovibrionales bacterium]